MAPPFACGSGDAALAYVDLTLVDETGTVHIGADRRVEVPDLGHLIADVVAHQ
jgi:hypothetical protein